jgi:hypothetical protein
MITKLTEKQESQIKYDKDILVAIEFFKKHGCIVLKVNKKNSSGPDLNIIKNDSAYRVEVKKLHYMKKSNCYYTDAVTDKRKNDDYVIVVTNQNVISFDSMENHLKLCSLTGIRVFTNEVQILEESRQVID